MAKSIRQNKEQLKFNGTFEEFIKKAVDHEPVRKIKKNDKVVKKDSPEQIYIVTSVKRSTNRIHVKKQDSEEILEFNQDDLKILEE